MARESVRNKSHEVVKTIKLVTHASQPHRKPKFTISLCFRACIYCTAALNQRQQQRRNKHVTGPVSFSSLSLSLPSMSIVIIATRCARESPRRRDEGSAKERKAPRRNKTREKALSLSPSYTGVSMQIHWTAQKIGGLKIGKSSWKAVEMPATMGQSRCAVGRLRCRY